jgi:hypothetical protein
VVLINATALGMKGGAGVIKRIMPGILEYIREEDYHHLLNIRPNLRSKLRVLPV